MHGDSMTAILRCESCDGYSCTVVMEGESPTTMLHRCLVRDYIDDPVEENSTEFAVWKRFERV